MAAALFSLPAWSWGQSPPAANYYVATTGLDTNPGTLAAPFATINKALGLCNGGQTVAVASGSYTAVRDLKVRSSTVTLLGYGTTQPVVQAAVGPNYAVQIVGGQFLTFRNLSFRSNGNSTLFQIASHPTLKLAQVAHDITIANCDLSNPNGENPGTVGPSALNIRDAAYNINVLNNYIHDSGSGITGPGLTSPASTCNGITIQGNRIMHFAGDAIQFGSWSNVLIDGNDIEYMADPSVTFHNDGIQFTGNSQNVTISNNFIAHSQDQLMLIQAAVGPVDNVLVVNNVIWDSGAYAVQSSVTHAKFINNTIFKSFYGGLLLRGTGINDTIVANNSLCGFGYYDGATSAYEDYNYLPGGGAGAHDIAGTNPGFVDSVGGNFHPATGSPLLAHGTSVYGPADDFDSIARGNPPTIGAFETTLGNTPIAYCGFDYAATNNIGTATDGPQDFGWATTTWTSNNKVVAPGLSYSDLPVIANTLSFGSNVGADRVISPAAIPAGYSVVGSDGITRLGAAGSTVWISFLIEPTANNTGTQVTGVNLLGNVTGGGNKLSIGNLDGTGYWAIKNPGSGGSTADATGAAPATTNQVAFLVAQIQFVAGSGNDVVKLWVNPPLGNLPPAIANATLTGADIGTFGTVEFKGNRASLGDEISLGTSWLSVTSGGQP